LQGNFTPIEHIPIGPPLIDSPSLFFTDDEEEDDVLLLD
jgi:hypothetical protein